MSVTCREMVELVTDYLDGALPEHEARSFEEHIEDCHVCGRYLEQMKITLRTVGRISGESISADARDTLMHAFRDWDAGRRAG
jgi:hypothetical protein